MAKYSVPLRADVEVEIDEARIRAVVDRAVEDWLSTEGKHLSERALLYARAIYDSVLKEKLAQSVDAEVTRIVSSVINAAEIRRLAQAAVKQALKERNPVEDTSHVFRGDR